MNIRIVRKGIAMFMALLVIMATSWALPGPSEARQVRNTTRGSVNRNINHNANRDRNVNRDIDIDVDHDYRHNYHPAARAVGVAAAATVTAAVVGSMVYSLPPACSTAVVGGISYHNCGGAWYQPQYAGTQVTYVVVNAPR